MSGTKIVQGQKQKKKPNRFAQNKKLIHIHNIM